MKLAIFSIALFIAHLSYLFCQSVSASGTAREFLILPLV